MTAPRVLVADDHPLVAEGLAAALRADGYEVIVATGGRQAHAVEIARQAQPDLVVLDLDLGPDVPGGETLIPTLREAGAAVVVLTGVEDPVQLARCLRAGALDVVAKADAFPMVVEQVRAAAGGVSPAVAHRHEELLGRLREHEADTTRRLAPFQRLTRREAEVLAGLMEGRSAEQIADAAYVSLPTVRTQIQSVLRKLDVGSQLAAVALARQAGWSAPATGNHAR